MTFNRKADMDTTRIKEIVNITLNGLRPDQYTWGASRINDTSYRIDIQTTVSLNEKALPHDLFKTSLGHITNE